jgi:cytochrome P450
MAVEDWDPPRFVMVTAPVSPMVELSRWLFERARVPYQEEGHAPIIHAFFTRRRNGGVEVPVVVGSGVLWKGARETLDGLDARLRGGDTLFGDTAEERRSNRALIWQLLDHLLLTVRRYAYFNLLPLKRVVYPCVTFGIPAWERAAVWTLYPVWRRLLGRALDFSPAAVEDAPRRIEQAFHLVEEQLAERGTPFLGGDRPNAVDIVFSALVAPVTLPPNYGSTLPALEDLPPTLRTFVDALRARRAGRLVLDTYAAERPSPQPPLRRPRRNMTLAQRLIGPRLQRLGARLASAIGRPLPLRGLTVVSRWADVHEVLAEDARFSIEPVNGPRFDVINGPFVLGLDRGPQFERERLHMYRALAGIDFPALALDIEREADRLLDVAHAAGGPVDVAHGYAHPIAARTAVRLFGVRGPTEADLMRVCRALFHYSFLNPNDERPLEERARRTAVELRAWIADEVARRRALAHPGDDVLGRLMLSRNADGHVLDDDGVRRVLGGMLVGAIDTTSTTVARILFVLGSRLDLLVRIERDVDDLSSMRAWCAEGLRMWPSAPMLFRRATRPTTVGGCPVRAGRLVGAFTQGAMFDGGVFPKPAFFEPSRPPSTYMNFGGGLHPCAGRDINDVQLPTLVARVVARGIDRVERPRFVGPFLDELIVHFRRPSQ